MTEGLCILPPPPKKGIVFRVLLSMDPVPLDWEFHTIATVLLVFKSTIPSTRSGILQVREKVWGWDGWR